MLTVFKTNDSAHIPKKAHTGDAGWDLYYCGDHPKLLLGNKINEIPTGIGVVIPSGYVGLVVDKSGRAKSGWKVVGGVIDSEYRGEVRVLLDTRFNSWSDIIDPHDRAIYPSRLIIQPGEKIAQILIVPCDTSAEVEVLDACPCDTVRGSDGFGSTGNF